MKYLIVIEKTETGFSAYSPDLPGCVSTGTTLEDKKKT
jgi:predicted RNase H-like HicB family nuclease